MRVAAFACEAGNGGEKALARLKEALGAAELDAEMVLIDPKSKPTDENEQKIKEFCDKVKESTGC